MTTSHFRIEPLNSKHDRKGFISGVEELDRYLQRQAGQDAKKHVAAPFVLLVPKTERVIGYYTLSAFTVTPCELSPKIAKKLPRYPLIPATLLGRLAVDKEFQGHGYGEILLVNAMRRTLEQAPNISTIGIVVEAHDDRALTFYRNFDFQPFPNHEKRLFLPLPAIARLFQKTSKAETTNSTQDKN